VKTKRNSLSSIGIKISRLTHLEEDLRKFGWIGMIEGDLKTLGVENWKRQSEIDTNGVE